VANLKLVDLSPNTFGKHSMRPNEGRKEKGKKGNDAQRRKSGTENEERGL
jgi:hypothetical protein